MLLSCDTEVLQEMCGGLAVLAHIIILFNLYYGINIHTDQDPKSWDYPQLVAATASFIYLGAFLSTFKWKRLSFDPHHHIESTLYALATTLPTLSVIFSCIGIGSVFWDNEETTETVFIVVLYTLNVIFLSVFSHILGLWTAPKKQKRQKLQAQQQQQQQQEGQKGTKTPPPTPTQEMETARSKLNDAEFLPNLAKAFPG